MNSITTYVIREAKKQGKDVEELAMEWLGNVKEPEVDDSGNANGAGAAGQSGSSTGTGQVQQGEETQEPGKPNSAQQPGEVQQTTVQEDVQAQIDSDAASVKVTVPEAKVTTQKPNDTKYKQIKANQQSGKEVADEIKQAFERCTVPFWKEEVDNLENALKKITKNNVAYVLEQIPDLADKIDRIDAFGYGFDKDEVIKYVLMPIGQAGEEYGWTVSNSVLSLTAWYSQDANSWSLEDIKNKITNVYTDIISEDKVTLEEYSEQLQAYDNEVTKVNSYNQYNLSKTQQTFDEANKFLAEVANMNPKPEIEEGHNNEKNYDWKKVILPDRRWIEVRYDGNGEISTILISHDTTPDYKTAGTTFDRTEIHYTATKAWYNIDKSNSEYEGSITSGYDFEALKTLAEKIFGKKNKK